MQQVRPALVVIDMQKVFIERYQDQMPDLFDCVEIINYCSDWFRERKHPVIFIQDVESVTPQSAEGAVISALNVFPEDSVVTKIHGNAFRSPEFTSVLEKQDINFLLLCGFRADGCVLATQMGAADRDFNHALIKGASLSPDSQAVPFLEKVAPILSPELIETLF